MNVFHVTAGNAKFAVSQWPTSPADFLYETRLWRGNAISEIFYSRLKKTLLETAMGRQKKHLISWWAEHLSNIAGRSDANQ